MTMVIKLKVHTHTDGVEFVDRFDLSGYVSIHTDANSLNCFILNIDNFQWLLIHHWNYGMINGV